MQRNSYLMNVNYKQLAYTALIAVAANISVVAFSQEILGTSAEFEPLSYGPVAVLTLVSAIGAYGILELKKKHMDNPYEAFMGLSSGVLILSFVPVLFVAPEEAGAGAVEVGALSLTHVVAAVAIVGTLLKIEFRD